MINFDKALVNDKHINDLGESTLSIKFSNDRWHMVVLSKADSPEDIATRLRILADNISEDKHLK